MSNPTTEELKDLLAKVSPDWREPREYDADEYWVGHKHWSSGPVYGDTGTEYNATLIALSPTLAAEVVRLRVVADAFKELLATVEGECHSLVDEDSGASQVLLNLMWGASQALSQK